MGRIIIKDKLTYQKPHLLDLFNSDINTVCTSGSGALGSLLPSDETLGICYAGNSADLGTGEHIPLWCSRGNSNAHSGEYFPNTPYCDNGPGVGLSSVTGSCGNGINPFL